jgi:hypothetical protein
MPKFLNCAAFGKKFDPRISKRMVQNYCKQGRVTGAEQMPGKTGQYVIPENAPDPRRSCGMRWHEMSIEERVSKCPQCGERSIL